MFSVALINYHEHDEMFWFKNNHNHLVGLLTSSENLDKQTTLLSMLVYAMP